VFLAGIQRTLPNRTRRVDFRDPCASRSAVSVLCIRSSKGDVVGRIHHHRNDVLLPYPHQCLEMVVLSREHSCLKHLRGEMLRIAVEVSQQLLKVRSFGSRDKPCAAPVVQQCSGQIGTRRRRELLDDQLFPAQPLRILWRRSHEWQEGTLRLVLLVEARLDGTHIKVEG